MGLLTPDPGLVFWMLVIFGAVFFILAKFGFPAIIKAVEDRKTYIDNSLKSAREANERLAHVKEESEQLHVPNRHASSVKRLPLATALSRKRSLKLSQRVIA